MKQTKTFWTCDACGKLEETDFVKDKYPSNWRGVYLTPVSYPEYDLRDAETKRQHVCDKCWVKFADHAGRLKKIVEPE
jgi:hypothetical protein